jgi:hypothetical protein
LIDRDEALTMRGDSSGTRLLWIGIMGALSTSAMLRAGDIIEG